MTISMYEASVPVFKTRLKALAAVLSEGERNATERKIDPQVFLMARLAPEGRIGEFFGLFALSGKVTSFMGPTLVALATSLFASQRAGLAVLIVFFLAGAWLLAGVRIERAP